MILPTFLGGFIDHEGEDQEQNTQVWDSEWDEPSILCPIC